MKRFAIVALIALIVPWQLMMPHLAVAAAMITATPNPVSAGNQLTITGSQFTPNATVTVAVSLQGGVVSQSAQTDASGNFQVALTIPAGTPAGQYTASAQVATYTPVTTTFNVQAGGGAQIALTPTSVAPGGQVTVKGTGWPANVPVNVGVSLPGGVVSQTAQTDAGGTFQVTLTIPAGTPAGQYTVSAQYGTTTPVTAPLGVVAAAQITLTPTSVAPGGQVAVKGTGWPANVPVNVVIIELTSLPGQTAQTDASGTFQVTLTIPAGTSPGTYTVSAQYGTTTPVTQKLQVTPGTPVPPPPPSVAPTATATAMPTLTPAPTSTSTVPPTPAVRLKFKRVTLRYRAVRAGSINRIDAQTNKRLRLPIQLQITYPNGAQAIYRGHTSVKGRWSRNFVVPRNARRSGGNTARVILRVTRGKNSATFRTTFRVVR